MKKIVTESEFIADFQAIRPNDFSRRALVALFDYFEELEDDLGEEIEFDPIAICCDYAEYETALEAAQDYGLEGNEEECIGLLRENSQVIEFNGGIVVLAY